jgi:hypothetical protein
MDRQRFFTILYKIDSTHSQIKYLRQLVFYGTQPKETELYLQVDGKLKQHQQLLATSLVCSDHL